MNFLRKEIANDAKAPRSMRSHLGFGAEMLLASWAAEESARGQMQEVRTDTNGRASWREALSHWLVQDCEVRRAGHCLVLLGIPGTSRITESL